MNIQEDYWMGWVIQPLNLLGTAFFVYDRTDSTGRTGFTILGVRWDAMRFIEGRVKFK